MNSGPPSALSLTDKQKYRERLCLEVDGLRQQVEELRQHVQLQQGNPQYMPQDQQQHLMAQLHSNRGLNPQQAAQQLSQQEQHRANIMNSLSSPSMMSGRDMRHPSSGMSQGGPSIPAQPVMSDGVISERLLHRKQAELNEIIDQQRKLYSNLDNLDRQRSQILGDIDKTAAYQKMTNDINFHFQGPAASRYPSHPNLRTPLSQNLPSHSAPHNMHPGHQMRSPSGNVGAARDALHGFPPSTMQFLSANRTGNHSMGKPDGPLPMMDSDVIGGFGNTHNGFPSKSPPGSTLECLRGRYEAKLQEMEQSKANNNSSDPTHMDKRRRFLGAEMTQKQHLGIKNFHDHRISSSYLPSEIMVTPKTAGDSLSVLSSSHQLLMNQREANMQREAQNMLYFQGLNSGRNQGVPNMNRKQHDGKLPENKRKLPKDFVAEVDTVVLGKGNIPKTNIGNLKLKGIVMDNLVEYANGERRKKIAVISRIINHVTQSNYNTTGFVKYEDEHWWEMTERDARVKITALFRDCLHDQYRSSSSSKVKRRQQLRKSRSLSSSTTYKEVSTGATEENNKKGDSPSDETTEKGSVRETGGGGGEATTKNNNSSSSEGGQNETTKRKTTE
jgi:hypothetical protein